MSEPVKFDPIKALIEEIQGLNSILTKITAETRQAEMRAAETATHYDNMLTLKGFAEGEIARKRRVLKQLQDEADHKS